MNLFQRLSKLDFVEKESLNIKELRGKLGSTRLFHFIGSKKYIFHNYKNVQNSNGKLFYKHYRCSLRRKTQCSASIFERLSDGGICLSGTHSCQNFTVNSPVLDSVSELSESVPLIVGVHPLIGSFENGTTLRIYLKSKTLPDALYMSFDNIRFGKESVICIKKRSDVKCVSPDECNDSDYVIFFLVPYMEKNGSMELIVQVESGDEVNTARFIFLYCNTLKKELDYDQNYLGMLQPNKKESCDDEEVFIKKVEYVPKFVFNIVDIFPRIGYVGDTIDIYCECYMNEENFDKFVIKKETICKVFFNKVMSCTCNGKVLGIFDPSKIDSTKFKTSDERGWTSAMQKSNLVICVRTPIGCKDGNVDVRVLIGNFPESFKENGFCFGKKNFEIGIPTLESTFDEVKEIEMDFEFDRYVNQ